MYLKTRLLENMFAIFREIARIKFYIFLIIWWGNVNSTIKMDERNTEENIKGPVHLLQP